LEIKDIEEENYFFRLSNYGDKLLEYLQREKSILPEWRREEAINFVKSGLEDFSISREKERLSWGIPVPGDESQVMYVWFKCVETIKNIKGDRKTYFPFNVGCGLAGGDWNVYKS
jgi:methionyl-tRNA synthetase